MKTLQVLTSRMLMTAAAYLGLAISGQATEELISRGASWRYVDDGSDQGTAWSAFVFDDTAWPRGPAQLGYGENDEATVLDYGGDKDNKHITSYLRLSFPVANPARFPFLLIRALVDDGAVMHLNGVEVARTNLPAGTIDYQTLALFNVGDQFEEFYQWFSVSGALLRKGRNVLAVEVHQAAPNSSDISFDLEILAAEHEFVTRGPYLQMGTPTSILVHWRTDLPTDACVWYGPLPAPLTHMACDPAVGFDHQVTLAGLEPGRKYYYAVGKTGQVLEGGDLEHYFVTSPPAGSSRPTRIWALGDCGRGEEDAVLVRDAFFRFNGSPHADLLLLLGDNAYQNGLDIEYQASVFDMYERTLRTTPVWPTRGNHDRDAVTYFSAFTMPTAGEIGGVPSGTESYYSFDYASIHFLSLDSDQTDRSVGGAMWTWAEADLAATDQEWLIAFWHHPPYSKGTHDSDTERNLIQMRENFLPLFESYGVDLVLCGHSHVYERSFLLDGHYGTSDTFIDSHKKNGGDGRTDGTGAYLKHAFPNAGAVYCVSGSSSQTGTGPLDHPAMYLAVMELGSVVLDIDGKRLDLQFIDEFGGVRDYCTIDHTPWSSEYHGLTGKYGVPQLTGEGTLLPGDPVTIQVKGAAELSPTFLILGYDDLRKPFHGGVLVPYPNIVVSLLTDLNGEIAVTRPFSDNVPSGIELFMQFWILDANGPQGFAATNAISVIVP